MTKLDAYAILEIVSEYMSDNICPITLKKAYRKAVKKYHPDHNPDVNPEEIKRVNEAYSRICSDFFIQEDANTQKEKPKESRRAHKELSRLQN